MLCFQLPADRALNLPALAGAGPAGAGELLQTVGLLVSPIASRFPPCILFAFSFVVGVIDLS